MITLTIQPQVPVIIGLTIFILISLKLVNKKLVAFNPLETPRGAVMVAMTIVELVEGFIRDIVSKKYIDTLGPYITSIAIYILLSNYIGLLGFENPTGSYSVTLTLAIISWTLIQITDIKYSGVKAYIHSFFEPIFLFVVPNFFGCVAPMISMSLRLFGNILSGTIIMQLVYTFTNFLSTTIINFVIDSFSFNFVGPLLAAPLHAYFDLFSGFIQMFIFIMLTMVFIGNKIPEDEK